MFHFGKQDISRLFLFKSFKTFVLKSKCLVILFGLSLYQDVGTLLKAPMYNRYFNDLKETTLWKENNVLKITQKVLKCENNAKPRGLKFTVSH